MCGLHYLHCSHQISAMGSIHATGCAASLQASEGGGETLDTSDQSPREKVQCQVSRLESLSACRV